MEWPPQLMLREPNVPWELDATELGVQPSEFDSLPWPRVFADMRALEAGEAVNVDEARQVGHYWLRAPRIAPTLRYANQIQQAREDVRTFTASVLDGTTRTPSGQRFTHVLHIGIGGSQLGPSLLLEALAARTPAAAQGLPVSFVDNTDPDGIAACLDAIGDALASTLVLVVTKSGSTPEPKNALALVRRRMTQAGLDVVGHLVAVTMEGSKLDEIAVREDWLARFPQWVWVGGRFSITSVVGLLPASLAGIDVDQLLAGAADMDAWSRREGWTDNPAAWLAGSWYLKGEGRGERAMVVLPYADRLETLSRYLQQLVMESIGKAQDRQGQEVCQGLTVYGNKGSTDQHAYVQQLRDGRNDFFALFLQVYATTSDDPELEDAVSAGDFLQGFLLGTRRALAENERHSFTITMPEISPYTVGGLIALFERAVSFYASLIDVNAYNQPGVEAGKKAAASFLSLSRELRALLQDGNARSVAELAALLSADPLEVYYILRHLTSAGRICCSGDPVHGTYTRTP